MQAQLCTLKKKNTQMHETINEKGRIHEKGGGIGGSYCKGEGAGPAGSKDNARPLGVIHVLEDLR